MQTPQSRKSPRLRVGDLERSWPKAPRPSRTPSSPSMSPHPPISGVAFRRRSRVRRRIDRRGPCDRSRVRATPRRSTGCGCGVRASPASARGPPPSWPGLGVTSRDSTKEPLGCPQRDYDDARSSCDSRTLGHGIPACTGRSRRQGPERRSSTKVVHSCPSRLTCS